MTHPRLYIEPEQLDANSDLQTVLQAWHGATLRLEQTHEALRQEVCRLTDELEAKNRELARKNRLADLGQMASHVAHEVRNCLVPVTLYLSLLRRRLAEDPVTRELLDKLAAGFTSLDATVNDLLNFTAQRDPQLRLVEVAALVDEVLESLAPQLDAQGIRVELDMSPMHRIWADRDMFRSQWSKTKKYYDGGKKKLGQGGMFQIIIDPSKCKGCAECVTVCDDDALKMIVKTDDIMLKARIRGDYVDSSGDCPFDMNALDRWSDRAKPGNKDATQLFGQRKLVVRHAPLGIIRRDHQCA